MTGDNTGMMYTQHFALSFAPLADPAAIVTGPNVRFTVLTSRLIRLEYSPAGQFEDRPSQVFWYRRQPVPAFKTTQTADRIEIDTDDLHLHYRVNPAGFTPQTLSIQLKKSGVTWHYGDKDPANLLGTGRTLDQRDGPMPLEPGLISRTGWSVLDDSRSLVFTPEGWLTVRAEEAKQQAEAQASSVNLQPSPLDLYFFGYGHDYIGCLRDFCRVAGAVPLIPRWALGNWWSRYWAYTQDELTRLMQDFRQHQLPLSVCIVDMDWHITETGNTSSGWTGYTWNRQLFPDPYGFIAWLHEQGLKTALNLHPAAGIHPHEAVYETMARFMGIDPASQQPVKFDIADPKFTQAYFEFIHHPMEAQGVDFWWLDWQQEKTTRITGLDPLWWLNHLHFYDLARDGNKRPFIFSRWGGHGNHRYPIGFSGDTIVSWASLAFQPYFTATAANVGYGWWSHDIGGHFKGWEDPELYTRWVQFGVFSPILRLHCTKNPYQDRRPWAHGDEVFRIVRDAMQLRHALIPYLYTMAWRNHVESIPLITPMYYTWPEEEAAYTCPHQYNFGSELIAAPNVTPADPETRLSRQVIWLPPGDWFNFFTGEHHAGGGWIALYSRLDEIPVFARAGAIVPLTPKAGWGGVDNPAALEIYIFPGADNTFTLYEDDGLSDAYMQKHYGLTPFSQTGNDQQLRFQIGAVRGDQEQVPAQREYRLHFRGVRSPDQVELTLNGAPHPTRPCTYDAATDTLSLSPVTLRPTDALTVTLSVQSGSLLSPRRRTLETCRKLLWAFRLDSEVKARLDGYLPAIIADASLLTLCQVDRHSELTESQRRALADTIRGTRPERVL